MSKKGYENRKPDDERRHPPFKGRKVGSPELAREWSVRFARYPSWPTALGIGIAAGSVAEAL